MHRFHWLLLIVFLSGCNPYVAAVSMTYGVATDARSVSTQASDTEIESAVKAEPARLAGARDRRPQRLVPPGRRGPGRCGPAGLDGWRRGGADRPCHSGVVRVETFFVSHRPSEASDLEIEAEIKAAFAADPNVMEERASVGVYGGHVILVGVVEDPGKIDEYVADAQSVPGVRSVRSYIQMVN